MDNRAAPDNLSARHAGITASQGFQVGDQNIQINLFGGRQPKGPVVAGNVPQAPPAFQPREDLMEKVRAAGPGVSIIRAVTGIRGVGKTQLAAAYARECRKAGWRLIAWVNAEDTPAILGGLSVVADRLDIDQSGKSLTAVGLEVRNRLEADGERCLIVFDNATDPDTVLPYAPSIGDCHVVITSTEAAMTGNDGSVHVGVFSEDEALAYLARRTKRMDKDGARTLAEELDFLPLALAQAAAVIVAQRLTFRVYLDRLRSYPVQNYLPPAKGDPYPHGVTEAIMLSIDAVTAADPTGLCDTLLGVVSLLSPDGVSTSMLKSRGADWNLGATSQDIRPRRFAPRRAKRNRKYPGTGDAFAYSARIDEALGRLADASLLAFSDDGSAVLAHRLVMRTVRERLLREQRLVVLGATARKMLSSYRPLLRAYKRIFGEDRWDRGADRNYVGQAIALTGHLAPYVRHGKEAKALRDLRSWASETRDLLGDSPSDAIARARKRVADSAHAHGEGHTATLGSRADLAEAYLESGRPAEAIEQLELVYAGCRRVLGETAPPTVSAAGQLAGLYVEAGRVSEAGPLLELWLKRQLALGWTDDDLDEIYLRSSYETAESANGLIPRLEVYVSVFSLLVGDEGLHTIQFRNNLASAYRTVGRLDEAIEQSAQALSGLERAWGPDHESTMRIRHFLASAYREAGRVGEAIPLLERVLAGLEQSRGAEHPDTVTVRANLADARQEAERQEEPPPAQVGE
jgi:tetratricopeptide (TPR) repeat protein